MRMPTQAVRTWCAGRRVFSRDVLPNPRRQIGEGREEVRDHDVGAIDVDDAEHLRGGGGFEQPEIGLDALAFSRRADVEVMNHHHPAERNLLGNLASRSVLGERLQNAVLRGKFSACHHLGRTGTLTASPACGPRLNTGAYTSQHYIE